MRLVLRFVILLFILLTFTNFGFAQSKEEAQQALWGSQDMETYAKQTASNSESGFYIQAYRAEGSGNENSIYNRWGNVAEKMTEKDFDACFVLWQAYSNKKNSYYGYMKDGQTLMDSSAIILQAGWDNYNDENYKGAVEGAELSMAGFLTADYNFSLAGQQVPGMETSLNFLEYIVIFYEQN